MEKTFTINNKLFHSTLLNKGKPFGKSIYQNISFLLLLKYINKKYNNNT